MQHTPTPPAAGQPTMTRADELGLEQQARMVEGLRQWLAAQHGLPVKQIETHISWVLVCGDRAYKIKKALRNPFLDQSSLALRQQACREELRLNRRLAPDLYLAVVPVTGSADSPALGGQAAVVDVAVCMRSFAQDGLWNAMAAHGELGPAQIDELVRLLGPFHAAATVADPNGLLGSPAQVRAPLLQSLDELDSLVGTEPARTVLSSLRAWEAAAFDRLAPAMALRQQQGKVRECHGDLHLGNVTDIDGRTTVFDGIEFNDDFC